MKMKMVTAMKGDNLRYLGHLLRAFAGGKEVKAGD